MGQPRSDGGVTAFSGVGRSWRALAYAGRRWLGAWILSAVGALTLAAPVSAEELSVTASRSGSAVAVFAQVSLKVPLAVIWETLTDYEHLPEFVPGIRKSRVLGRRGPAAIVEQDGEAGFLFFQYPVRVVVESAEFPPHLITIRVLRGNLKQLEGRYQIEQGASAEDHVLRWTGLIEPDTLLPGFITVHLVQASIEKQFVGMVKEIERRQALRLEKEAHVSKR